VFLMRTTRPTGVEWPRLSAAVKEYRSERQSSDEPLWFLSQINLAEVAFADVLNVLPKAGMLYFFFHWHGADKPEAPDAGVVLFHKGRDYERAGHGIGLRKGIEVVLRLRFGAEGLKLMPAINEIYDVEQLEKILKALETAASPDEVRRLWSPGIA
jgi:hypothetical protein